jgi:hypothetical protein
MWHRLPVLEEIEYLLLMLAMLLNGISGDASAGVKATFESENGTEADWARDDKLGRGEVSTVSDDSSGKSASTDSGCMVALELVQNDLLVAVEVQLVVRLPELLILSYH